MSIDEYSHLWDGTESGWTLHHYNRVEWKFTFCFGDDGPTLADISAMRETLDDFRDQPVKSIWDKLRGKATYSMPETLSNLEMRWLVDKADRAVTPTGLKDLLVELPSPSRKADELD